MVGADETTELWRPPQIELYYVVGCSCGLVVSVLSFYYGDPSSNADEVKSFLLFLKNVNK